MSAATDFDHYHRLGDSSRYIVTRPLLWELESIGSGRFLEIPAGHTFDSSVPWALRWLVSQHHRPWLLAACVHDYMLKIAVPGTDQPLYSHARAAAEWHVAATAMAKKDKRRWLVKPALIGIISKTVPA